MNNKTMVLSLVAVVVIIATVFMLGAAKKAGDTNAAGATSTPATTTTTGSTGGTGSTGSTGGSGTVTAPRTTTTLAFGAEGGVGDVVIKPTTLVEDTRCATNEECTRDNEFRANVIFTTDGGTVSRTMELGKPQDIPGGQIVTLVSVTPAAFAGGTPTLESYLLTFKVEQK